MLAQKASRDVVVLSGSGGDELSLGYQSITQGIDAKVSLSPGVSNIISNILFGEGDFLWSDDYINNALDRWAIVVLLAKCSITYSLMQWFQLGILHQNPLSDIQMQSVKLIASWLADEEFLRTKSYTGWRGGSP
jgi:asparagine synthetase B (glutamine-hydrolysing)